MSCQVSQNGKLLNNCDLQFSIIFSNICYQTLGHLLALPPRFLNKIDFRVDGCWQWTGAKHHHQRFPEYAYGMFAAKGTPESITGAHRFAYEATVGPIPEGKEIDHQCQNKLCVNPAHLRAVTHKENCSTRRKRGRVPGSIRWMRENGVRA